MKTSILFRSALLLACSLYAPSLNAEEIGMIPLRSTSKSVGLDGQMTFNDGGKAAGSDIFYNKDLSRLGIGVIEPTVRLSINGSVEASEYIIDGNPVGKNTDNVVAGKLGIGFDMVNNYPFGDDTLVFSENNLRIQFKDKRPEMSDWRIKINDSNSGGVSYFAIYEVPKSYNGNEGTDDDDATFPSPFRIASDGTPGPVQAMTVKANSGRVGIGTVSPHSTLQVAGYTQLTPTSGPPFADCNEEKERGRLQINANGTMFICSNHGWLQK